MGFKHEFLWSLCHLDLGGGEEETKPHFHINSLGLFSSLTGPSELQLLSAAPAQSYIADRARQAWRHCAPPLC